jgi:hypothetical protein
MRSVALWMDRFSVSTCFSVSLDSLVMLLGWSLAFPDVYDLHSSARILSDKPPLPALPVEFIRNYHNFREQGLSMIAH